MQICIGNKICNARLAFVRVRYFCTGYECTTQDTFLEKYTFGTDQKQFASAFLDTFERALARPNAASYRFGGSGEHSIKFGPQKPAEWVWWGREACMSFAMYWRKNIAKNTSHIAHRT
ncbi:unnamed protein product [Amoebophrya sp. A120]|nr:unnamed protein product [Amoebophrya sp. A120]|eukprot:GSA120T00013542001.1